MLPSIRRTGVAPGLGSGLVADVSNTYTGPLSLLSTVGVCNDHTFSSNTVSDERTEKDSADFVDSKEKSGFLTKLE